MSLKAGQQDVVRGSRGVGCGAGWGRQTRDRTAWLRWLDVGGAGGRRTIRCGEVKTNKSSPDICKCTQCERERERMRLRKRRRKTGTN